MFTVRAVMPYMQLMRFHRPIGTLLLLWPTLIAVWMASNGKPNYHDVLIFVLGVIVMRAAGCVINDFADRNLDVYVARTRNRPLVQKRVTEKNALRLFLLLLVIALCLVLQLNAYTMKLSIIALCLAIIYPFAKRFTNYPQFILGLAFSWSIPMAYAQIHGGLTIDTWILYSSVLAWVVAYDTQYGMVDKEYDLKVGIKSTAIAFGDNDKEIIFILQLVSISGFTVLGIKNSLDNCYFICLSLALLFAMYQQWLIKDRDPERCFAAFLNNNYFGAIIFLGSYLC